MVIHVEAENAGYIQGQATGVGKKLFTSYPAEFLKHKNILFLINSFMYFLMYADLTISSLEKVRRGGLKFLRVGGQWDNQGKVVSLRQRNVAQNIERVLRVKVVSWGQLILAH